MKKIKTGFIAALFAVALVGGVFAATPHDAVRVATTANITLSGVQTVDGVVLVAGDRVLVKNQTLAKNNGIWVVAAGAWYRAADARDTNYLATGDSVYVASGSASANKIFYITTTGQIVIGTTSIAWSADMGSSSFAGDNTDVVLSADSTGGNAGARNEFSGRFRMKPVSTGAGTNGTTETTSYSDDSPTGEYAPVDASVTEAEGSVAGFYRVGSSSYRANFLSTAVATDGFKRTITTDDLEANESIGMWLYPTVTVASANLQILLTDDGGARNFDIPALTANYWNWVEIDISALAAGTGDVVTEFGITLTTAGATALGAFTVYMDAPYKWDADNEEALGVDCAYDCVLGVQAVATAAGSANTLSDLVEHTDYFVNYQSGNDVLIWITDQSAASCSVTLAY